MTRVELPDGAWAELAEPRKVSERKRRPVVAAMTALASHRSEFEQLKDGEIPDGGVGPELIEAGNALNDAGVVALVSSWSFGQPITLDGLLDLPSDAYDALQAAVAPLITAMLPDFDEPNPDPGSPSPS